MSFFLLIFKSAFRNRLRTMLTVGRRGDRHRSRSSFLRTIIAAWHAGVENSQSDRMFARNKISIIFDAAARLRRQGAQHRRRQGRGLVRELVRRGLPKDEHAFFANFAADDDAFKMYPEIVIPPDQWKAYAQDRQGAIVGKRLAEKYGWKIGDSVTLARDDLSRRLGFQHTRHLHVVVEGGRRDRRSGSTGSTSTRSSRRGARTKSASS